MRHEQRAGLKRMIFSKSKDSFELKPETRADCDANILTSSLLILTGTT